MARPRKKGMARDASGKARGELPAEAVSVVVAQRIRAGASPEAARSVLWGSSIGILRATDQINERQYETAIGYAEMIYRYCRLRGLPLPFPKSPSLMGAGGASLRPDPEDENVLRAKHQHSAARTALLKAGMAIGQGSRVNEIVFAVCIENREVVGLTEIDIENLKSGLNSLAGIVK